jgi:hypothetical protein
VARRPSRPAWKRRTMTHHLLTHLPRPSSFYPITQFYVIAVAVVIAAVNGWLTITGASIVLGFAAVISLGVMVWKEARTVHKLVDGQRAEMIDRIDRLVDLLVEHQITPPPEGEKAHEGREEVQTERAEGTFPGGSA